jgi:1-aminocyclopropane-1-carboxylate deaminase/D-cysteine desulfhydrase-like pyridoxal-dependent ACC family enzyme
MGQLLGGLELCDQVSVRGLAPASVVLPTATGGTQAGVLVGLRVGGLASRVEGIAVAQPAADLRPVVERLVRELGGMVGLVVPAGEVRIDDEHLGPGYGRPTVAADEATRLLARTEGILVDPIYTAKALAGLVAAVRAGRHDGQSVVFWHAGGTPGLFEALPE